MTKVKIPFNGVVYSDIHLGHRNTLTTDIIESMKQDIMDDIKQFKPKILLLAGDLFDRHLPLTSDDSKEAGFFLAWLLSICKKHNIILRMLEGTPSHEWKQGWLLTAINQSSYIRTNAKWVHELSIEHIPELDINILYIPDEWSASTEDTKHQVIALLAKHNLKQVDITLMHGMFPHQIPPHVTAPVHDHDFYSEITKLAIFCGHVHKFSQLGILTVPGSHNRLAHGEEEPKGHIRFSFKAKERNITFVENKAAQIYKTILTHSLELDDLMPKLKKELHGLKDGSFIRLMCNATDIANIKGKEIRDLYPSFIWKIEIESNAKETLSIQEDSSIYRTTPITDMTISDLVRELSIEKGLGEQQINSCLSALEEVKTWIQNKGR